MNGIDTAPIITLGKLRHGEAKGEQAAAGPVTAGCVHGSQGRWRRRDPRAAPLRLPRRRCQRSLHFHRHSLFGRGLPGATPTGSRLCCASVPGSCGGPSQATAPGDAGLGLCPRFSAPRGAFLGATACSQHGQPGRSLRTPQHTADSPRKETAPRSPDRKTPPRAGRSLRSRCDRPRAQSLALFQTPPCEGPLPSPPQNPGPTAPAKLRAQVGSGRSPLWRRGLGPLFPSPQTRGVEAHKPDFSA